MHFIKKYPFSCVCIALIWILSLLPFFPETPLDNVEFIDKWVHVVMYGGTFTVLWIEYIRQHETADYEKLFFWAFVNTRKCFIFCQTYHKIPMFGRIKYSLFCQIPTFSLFVAEFNHYDTEGNLIICTSL